MKNKLKSIIRYTVKSNAFIQHYTKYILTTILLTLGFECYTQQASFQGLGDFSGGDLSSEAISVSADGSAVSGTGTTDKGSQAFIWTESTGMVSLGNLADNSFKVSWASKISADGQTVVGDGDPVGVGNYYDRQGFVWTAADGMTKIGSLNSSDFYQAQAVSADGSVIAGNGGQEAFYWTKSNGIVGLGTLPGNNRSEIVALSADGTIAAGISSIDSIDSQQPLRWTENEGMVGLGFLPGTSTGLCNSISPDGSVIVGTCFSTSRFYAFRWTQEKGMRDMGSLTGKNIMHPAGATMDGSVIVGGGWSNGTNGRAFIWDSINGMRDLKTVLESEYDLDLTGWILERANAITPDGNVIVGNAINPSGKTEGFRVVLRTASGISNTTSENMGAKLFPNPTTGRLALSFGSIPVLKVITELYNTDGKFIFSDTFLNSTTATIDLTGYPAGMYLIKVVAGEKHYEEKIVKE
jgi:uncharacterized membrane protein